MKDDWKQTNFILGGEWCVKYELFGPIPNNYSIITNDFNSTVITSSKISGRILDISFCSAYKCAIGFHNVINFYVDTNITQQLKSRLLVSHVMRHLILISQRKYSGLISILLDIHEKTISSEKLTSVLHELQFPETQQWSCRQRPSFILRLPVSDTRSKL